MDVRQDTNEPLGVGDLALTKVRAVRAVGGSRKLGCPMTSHTRTHELHGEHG